MRGRVLFLGLTPLLGAFALFGIAGLRINTSASLPAGLYIASSEGSFVEFCPYDHGLSAQRGYRHNGVWRRDRPERCRDCGER
jgi:type IV secretory pathway protease TraF